MNYSNLTISELDRAASESTCDLVQAMNAKIQELVEEIEALSVWEEIGGSEIHFKQQVEYLKKLAGLANNY